MIRKRYAKPDLNNGRCDHGYVVDYERKEDDWVLEIGPQSCPHCAEQLIRQYKPGENWGGDR